MGNKKNTNSGSIFSQTLDRAIFVTYFLGAIVPMFALGVTMHSYVFPAVADDAAMTSTMLGVMVGVSALNLSAFFALRRLTRNAIDKMDADNARLKGILSVSRDLSTSFHASAVSEIATSCARQLTSAEVTLMLVRQFDDKPLVMVASSGEAAQSVYGANEDLIRELVENCLSTRTATSLGSGSGGSTPGGDSANEVRSALAFPMIDDDGSSGAVVALNSTSSDGQFPSNEQDALMTLTTQASVALRNVNLQDAQRNFFAHITELLVAAMDTHIEGRRGHAMAVAQLSNRLARELGFAEEKMQRLHFASLLHDLGMLKVDRAHQRSPGHFQKHPQLAYRILSRIRLWEDVAPIVLYHHEWFDGSGYPEARSGSDIPLESRVIAVADTYDALIRPGAHRMAMSPENAVAEIVAHAGTQFDPRVTAALEQLADRHEIPGAENG